MKVLGNDSISKYIKIILQMIFVLGALVILLLPWLLDWYTQMFGIDLENIKWAYLVILYASGIPALILIYQFIKLFDTLKQGTPFIMENAKKLKQASIVSCIIALEYLIGIFVIRTVFTIIIFMVFVIAWIGLYILSELIKQAVEYKEDVDLTI